MSSISRLIKRKSFTGLVLQASESENICCTYLAVIEQTEEPVFANMDRTLLSNNILIVIALFKTSLRNKCIYFRKTFALSWHESLTKMVSHTQSKKTYPQQQTVFFMYIVIKALFGKTRS